MPRFVVSPGSSPVQPPRQLTSSAQSAATTSAPAPKPTDGSCFPTQSNSAAGSSISNANAQGQDTRRRGLGFTASPGSSPKQPPRQLSFAQPTPTGTKTTGT